MTSRMSKTRREYRLSDGRVPTKNTKIEKAGLKLLRELGYFYHKDVTVKVPASWTRYGHDIELYPDAVVNVRLDQTERLYQKAILFDGWHYHNRTLHQEASDEKKDGWYNMAGYFVIHVGDWWFKSSANVEKLKPLLADALVSSLPVVNLAH